MGSAAVRDRRVARSRAAAAATQGVRDERGMTIEILVNIAPRETRAAVVENGALQDVLIERPSRRGLVSNIYKGRVMRVLPGMQAAFLEIGLARTGFLHAADILRAPQAEGSDTDSRAHGERQWQRHAGARHPRAAARGRRAAGAGGQGSARHQGRAALHARGAALALPRLHAARQPRRRVLPHRGRSRARAAARADLEPRARARRSRRTARAATSCGRPRRARRSKRCTPT